MKIALAVIIAVVIALFVAMRIPASARVLEDVPGLDLLVDLVGYHDDRPIEYVFGFEHPVSTDVEGRVRDVLARRLAPMAVEMRGDQLVVAAPGLDDAMRVQSIETRHAPLRVLVVIYQSPELDALRAQLRKDDQAQKLGLSIELDHVGFHVHAQSTTMYVNSDWAKAHDCTGYYIEGTGTSCAVSPKQRVEAYVRGDPGLFTDPHPLAFPPGRDLYLVNTGDYYEMETAAIAIAPSQVTAATVDNDALVLAVAPDVVAAIAARVPTPDVELVVETRPGQLYPAQLLNGRLSVATGPADARDLAGDLQLASAGLVLVR
jgi:hypothetical protein